MADDTMEARVARGAALLDERDPGWADKINPITLDMGDCKDCILGQRFGEYTRGLHELSPDWANDESETQATRHGFTTAYGSYGHRISPWHRLESLWVAQIKARTAATV